MILIKSKLYLCLHTKAPSTKEKKKNNPKKLKFTNYKAFVIDYIFILYCNQLLNFESIIEFILKTRSQR